MKTRISGAPISNTWPGQTQEFYLSALILYSLLTLPLFLFSHGDKPDTVFWSESPVPVTVPLASVLSGRTWFWITEARICFIRRMPVAQRIEGLGGKTQIAHLWERLRTQITSLYSKCKLPGQSKRPKSGSEPNAVRYAVGRWGEGRTGPHGMGWGRSSSQKEQWRFLTSIRGKEGCVGKKKTRAVHDL